MNQKKENMRLIKRIYRGVITIFEDIKEQKTEQEKIQDLETWKKDATELLQEGRDEIERLQDESLIMDRKFNQAYQDARRMAGILTKEIDKERLDKICKEQERIEKILEEANILDD